MPVNCATAEGDIRMLQSELATNQRHSGDGVVIGAGRFMDCRRCRSP
jgi:hypothetical protein